MIEYSFESGKEIHTYFIKGQIGWPVVGTWTVG